MMPIVLFVIAAIVILGLLYVVHQLWQSYTQFTPEDKEFEDRVALLNDHQSNRMSDQQLLNPPTAEDAWTLMVQRGVQRRRRLPRRSTSRLQ